MYLLGVFLSQHISVLLSLLSSYLISSRSRRAALLGDRPHHISLERKLRVYTPGGAYFFLHQSYQCSSEACLISTSIFRHLLLIAYFEHGVGAGGGCFSHKSGAARTLSRSLSQGRPGGDLKWEVFWARNGESGWRHFASLCLLRREWRIIFGCNLYLSASPRTGREMEIGEGHKWLGCIKDCELGKEYTKSDCIVRRGCTSTRYKLGWV